MPSQQSAGKRETPKIVLHQRPRSICHYLIVLPIGRHTFPYTAGSVRQSVQITEKHKRQQAEIKATSKIRRKANDGNNTRCLPSGYISLSLSLRTYSMTSNMSSSKSSRTLGCYLFHFFSYSTSYPSVQRPSSYDT